MGNGNKDEEKDGVKQSPWSLLAMLPGIAGDAAKIFSSPEKDSLREMQRGGGVGSRAIAAAQQRASRDQLSAQAVGHGATRGLGILAASDRGNEAMERLMPALGMTAAREQALATDQLRQNRAAQLASAANLGWKLTGGIGGAIANMVAAKDQGEPGQPDEADLTRDPMGLREATAQPDQPLGQEQAPGVVGDMSQRGEVLPGAGVSPHPIADEYLFPGQGAMEQQMGASPDAAPAQTPEQNQVEKQRGAEERRKMQQAQTQNDLAIIKATSSAIDPAPDAPLGTAVLTPDPAAAPLDDSGIQEWIWGKYRDGDVPLEKVQEILSTYGLPLEPPEWFQWAGGF
jgi:hypothetical protein